jgi:hypothetical protein
VKKITALIVTAALLFVACGADQTNSISSDQNETNAQLQQYQAVQPVPFFNWSMMRQVMIDIYQAQNESRQTWAVFIANNGTPIFSCESEGYPIPATTQLTNPSQVVTGSGVGGNNYAYGVVGQMEPNGTYTGNSLGTYVLCVRPDGKLSPVYSEPYVMMFPFEVKVVNGQIVDQNGAATISLDLTPPANVKVVTPSPAPTK